MPSTKTGFQPGSQDAAKEPAGEGPGPAGQTIFGRDVHLPREVLDQIARRAEPAVVPIESPGSGRVTISGAQAGPRVAPAPVAPPHAVTGGTPPAAHAPPVVAHAAPVEMPAMSSAMLPPPELPSWVDDLDPLAPSRALRTLRTMRLPRHEGMRTIIIVALAMVASFSLVAGVMKMRTAFRGGAAAAIESSYGVPPRAAPAGATVVVPATPLPVAPAPLPVAPAPPPVAPAPSSPPSSPSRPAAAATEGASVARSRPARGRTLRARVPIRPRAAPAARSRRNNNDDAIMIPKFAGS
jgi:hypothetical protein